MITDDSCFLIAASTCVMISFIISPNISFTSSLMSMLVVSSKVTGATVDSYVVLVTSELESEIIFRFWSGGDGESSFL